MQSVKCQHHEHLESTSHGIQIGTCSLCGQVSQYADGKATITKLGRISGALVIPDKRRTLLLSSSDKEDLKEVAPSENSNDKPPHREIYLANKKRREFYQANKRQMIETLIALGQDAFLEKWKVSPQTISHLKNDNLYKEMVQSNPPGQLKVWRLDNDLPPLPKWNEIWPAEVQLKWLDIWRALHKF